MPVEPISSFHASISILEVPTINECFWVGFMPIQINMKIRIVYISDGTKVLLIVSRP
jgi:hypothetical protein